MKTLQKIGIMGTVIFSVTSSFGQLCPKFSYMKVDGYLDTAILKEASGVAISSDEKYLFHVNDGRTGALFITDRRGSNTRRIDLKGFRGSDIEELASGRVGTETYLILGDIGDNRRKREYLRLGIVNERMVMASMLSADEAASADLAPIDFRDVFFTYPDGPHDAEAMAFHPSGDLYIVTKEEKRTGADAARIYRLDKNQWQKLPSAPARPHIMEFIGELNIPKINGDAPDYYGKLVTSMDIHMSGESFVLLTYNNIVEFGLNLDRYNSTKQIPRFTDHFRKIGFQRLTQQEAVRYLPRNGGLLITTEFDATLGLRSGAVEPERSPLLILGCGPEPVN